MNIIQYIKRQEFNGLIDESKIVEAFNVKYIKVSYERPEDNDVSRRYIFTANRYNNKYVSFSTSDLVLRSEANGLILQSTGADWIALVIPPRTPKTANISASTLDKFYQAGKYFIYKVKDGTIINLYYYDQKSKWIISTARGIEVNTQIFNTMSYQDMFEQSLTNIGLDKEEFYNSLDKKSCYAFGFKHPDMHPFQEAQAAPVYKVWFVQSTLIENEHNDARAEFDVNLKINKKSQWEKIPQHIIVKTQFRNVAVIYDSIKASYDNFIYNKKPINFGYILIAKDINDFNDEDIEYSKILLESTLMNYICKFCYDLYGKKELKEYINKSFSKTMIVNAYLSDKNYEAFRSLFPQFKYEYDKISNIMKKLIDDILLYAAGNVIVSTNEYKRIVKILTRSVSDKITISTTKNPKQQIQDIIHTIDNFSYFFKLMNDDDDDDDDLPALDKLSIQA
jgi:hypothetical protein